MLFFTNTGKVYWLKVYEIPPAARNAKGKAIVNLLNISNEEKITAILSVRDFNEMKGHYVIMATRNGTVKKTPMEDYSRPRNGGIIAIKLDEGDSLIEVKETNGEDTVMLSTLKGMAIKFSEKDVKPQGRSTRGVRGIVLDEGDAVIGMATVEPGNSFLTACVNGYGKRTMVENYRMQRRGGHGVINIKATDRNGEVVAVRKVEVDDEIMIITKNGIINRQKVSEIRAIGRNTQGVRLIDVEDSEKVTGIAPIAEKEEGDEE